MTINRPLVAALFACLTVSLLGCAPASESVAGAVGSPPASAAESAAAPAGAAGQERDSSAAQQPPATLAVEPRPELAEVIAAAGYRGTFVVLDPAAERLIAADAELAARRFIPASTFKIANSLIALETGVASGPEFRLAWDGVERRIAAWNRDHDLRSAFAASVVWYYQELARRIGEARMAEWVTALDYGNADISGDIDRFWLDGALRISPREQVEFLRRLHEGDTPLRPDTVTRFLDEVMVHARCPGLTVRAKTGWSHAPDEPGPQDTGWFVGSLERGSGERVYFATLLLSDEDSESFASDRLRLSWQMLRELGYLEAAERADAPACP